MEKLRSNLQLWHLIVGLAVTIIGGAATAGFAWASVNAQILDLKEKALKVEDVPERLARIETKQDSTKQQLDRIESKLDR